MHWNSRAFMDGISVIFSIRQLYVYNHIQCEGHPTVKKCSIETNVQQSNSVICETTHFQLSATTGPLHQMPQKGMEWLLRKGKGGITSHIGIVLRQCCIKGVQHPGSQFLGPAIGGKYKNLFFKAIHKAPYKQL